MKNKPLLWITLLALLTGTNLNAQVPVPNRMTYCGVELTLTPSAKKIIEDYVGKIYESPRYFNEMVKRASLYMPFIEEALQNVGVPDDLKYLAIQESALRPDVISSSNAVGFWQFKEATALQYGLRVDDRVDERQHIYRSSEAAAEYLANANRDFDNWLYAVLAYYEGLTGAVPHTDPQYYSTRQMVVEEQLHWYVLKAIAHKIAYEAPLLIQKVPPLFLKPYSNEGDGNLSKIIEKYGVSEEEFLEYNKWVLNIKKLPKNELFTYYIPQPGVYYTGHIPDPNKVMGGGKPLIDPNTQMTNTTSSQSAFQQPVATKPTEPINSLPPSTNIASGSSAMGPMTDPAPIEATAETVNVVVQEEVSPSKPQVVDGGIQMPKARKITGLNQFSYVEFVLQYDLHYEQQFVYYDGSALIVEIANRYKKRLTDLLVWNGLIPGEEPIIGNMVYLDKPSKREHHIVRPGETLFDIAALHLTTVKKLQKLNRISRGDFTIYVGQKLYLKEKKPKEEKLIILTPADPRTLKENTPPAHAKPLLQDAERETLNNISTIAEATPRPIQPAVSDVQTTPLEGVSPTSGNAPQKRWVQHVVQPGETLWGIAQLYKTKVAIIKQINKLETDAIHEGQTLRILGEI